MEYYLTWAGIVLCLIQSAIFSGLNLSFFNISRLRLEVQVANGDRATARVLTLRKDSNFLLATILWGNVSINVLLALLSNSIMTGLSAFVFSTFVITLGGELAPQAYFSRNAVRMASALAPLSRLYQILLYPLSKPSALVLDFWLGRKGLQYFRERELRQLIHKHMNSVDGEVDAVEGIGALNFLAMDDVPIACEGEVLDNASIFEIKLQEGNPQFFPDIISREQAQNEFALRAAACPHRWIVLAEDGKPPALVLDADAYLRAIFTAVGAIVDPLEFCHCPIVVTDPNLRLGAVIARLKTGTNAQSDLPLTRDIILLCGD